MTDLDLQRIRLYWDPVVRHLNSLKDDALLTPFDFSLRSSISGLTDYLRMTHLPKHKRKADELSLNYVDDQIGAVSARLLDVDGDILDSSPIRFVVLDTALANINNYLVARRGAVDYDRLINNFDRSWQPDWV